jgi:hypothetical protein
MTDASVPERNRAVRPCLVIGVTSVSPGTTQSICLGLTAIPTLAPARCCCIWSTARRRLS